jgi:hypothetical protein
LASTVIVATARELSGHASIEAALKCLGKRKNEPPKAASDFTGTHPRRVYEAIADVFWTNVLTKEEGHYFDERVVAGNGNNKMRWQR